VSLRLHRHVLGLSPPHSLHSLIGRRRGRFSLPEAHQFVAPRLLRPRLRRLDTTDEDFPRVSRRRLAVHVLESRRCAEGRR
jgi:hypothetical protein